MIIMAVTKIPMSLIKTVMNQKMNHIARMTPVKNIVPDMTLMKTHMIA